MERSTDTQITYDQLSELQATDYPVQTPQTEVFEEFYREHYDYASYVARMHEDPEGIAQETMIRALRKIEINTLDVSDLQRSHGWVKTTTNHLLIDHYRAAKVRRPANEEATRQYTSTDPLSKVEDQLVLAEVLGQLTPAHREIIEEVYLNGRLLTETSETLGLAYGTAQSRVFYGLRAARKIMGELGLTYKDFADSFSAPVTEPPADPFHQ